MKKIVRLRWHVFYMWFFPLCFLLVWYNLFGIFNDTNDGSFRVAQMSGIFNGTAIKDYFIYYVGISQVLSFLYALCTAVPWYWILMYGLLYAATCLFLEVVYLALYCKGAGHWLGLCVLASFLHLFCFKYYQLFDTTRVAVLVAGMPLANMLYHYVSGNGLSRHRMLFCLLLFALGMCVRYEAGLVSWLVVGGMSFWVALFSSSFGSWVKWQLPSLGVVLVFMSIYMLNDYEDRRDFDEIEPYVFAMQDTGNNVEAKNMSAQDSIRLVAVKNWFFVDKGKITPRFLGSYVSKSKIDLKNLRNWRSQLSKLLVEVKYAIAKESTPVFAFNGMALIVAFLLFVHDGRVLDAVGLLGSQLLFWTAILFIGLVIKMENRLLSPLLLLWTAVNLVFLSFYFGDKVGCLFTWERKWLGLLVLFLLPALGCVQANNYRQTYYWENAELQLVMETRNEINRLFKNKTLVFDLPACVQFTIVEPFRNCEDLRKNNRILSYDSGYGAYYRPYEDAYERLAGSNSYEDFMNYLYKNSQDVVFVANPERLGMKAEYLKILYGMKFSYTEVYNNSVISKDVFRGMDKRFAYFVIEDAEGGDCDR